MSDFRDAIATALNHSEPLHGPKRPSKLNLRDADAVLAAPEMQAIREALWRSYVERYHINAAKRIMASDGLPPTVIAWALRQEQ